MIIVSRSNKQPTALQMLGILSLINNWFSKPYMAYPNPTALSLISFFSKSHTTFFQTRSLLQTEESRISTPEPPTPTVFYTQQSPSPPFHRDSGNSHGHGRDSCRCRRRRRGHTPPMPTYGYQQYHHPSWRPPPSVPSYHTPVWSSPSVQPFHTALPYSLAPSQQSSILGPRPSQTYSVLPHESLMQYQPSLAHPPTPHPAPWFSNAAIPPSDLHLPYPNWYMDTGATSHLASDLGILCFILNNCQSVPEHVLIGSGSQVPVTTRGHASHPNSSFSLYILLLLCPLLKILLCSSIY